MNHRIRYFIEVVIKIRKFRLVGIGILIVVIIVIIYYNYNVHPIIPLPTLPPTTDVEIKKSDMIYPTKMHADEWVMNPSNLDKDERFDPKANLTRNSDGSWSVDSKEHTRLSVWKRG